jgi:hypothetical protein
MAEADGGGGTTFGIEMVFDDATTNAVVAWILVAFVVVVAVANLVSGELLWAGFAATVAVLAVLPPVQFRTPRAMLPWEVLLLAILWLVLAKPF